VGACWWLQIAVSATDLRGADHHASVALTLTCPEPNVHLAAEATRPAMRVIEASPRRVHQHVERPDRETESGRVTALVWVRPRERRPSQLPLLNLRCRPGLPAAHAGDLVGVLLRDAALKRAHRCIGGVGRRDLDRLVR